jgi:hypothetical protein
LGYSADPNLDSFFFFFSFPFSTFVGDLKLKRIQGQQNLNKGWKTVFSLTPVPSLPAKRGDAQRVMG